MVGLERGDEALDVLGHIRVAQPLEIGQHRAHTIVQALLELIDFTATEQAIARPPAVGAFELQFPLVGAASLQLTG